jgi:hypothetical protein
MRFPRPQKYGNERSLCFIFLPCCLPEWKVTKFTSILYGQWLDACCSKSHSVIRFMKQGVFNTLDAQLFRSCKQLKFRFNANQDQMNYLVWFFEFKPCLQTGMTNLNNLIRKRNVDANQDIDIQGGKLLISHWNSPDLHDRHQMGRMHL